MAVHGPAYPTVKEITEKVYAVATSLFGVGPTRDRTSKTSGSAGFTSPQTGVTRSKRRVASVELVFSDDLPPNNDHPLANLSPEDRQRHRLLKLAEIIAQAAARRATRQTSNKKETV